MQPTVETQEDALREVANTARHLGPRGQKGRTLRLMQWRNAQWRAESLGATDEEIRSTGRNAFREGSSR